jgi:hypothetical protein
MISPLAITIGLRNPFEGACGRDLPMEHVDVRRSDGARSRQAAAWLIIATQPAAQTRLADPEIPSDLRQHLLTATDQLDSTKPELRRVGSRHLTGRPFKAIIASSRVPGKPVRPRQSRSVFALCAATRAWTAFRSASLHSLSTTRPRSAARCAHLNGVAPASGSGSRAQ